MPNINTNMLPQHVKEEMDAIESKWREMIELTLPPYEFLGLLGGDCFMH
jgi:hypothetical protein